jgi:hypothetical protein
MDKAGIEPDEDVEKEIAERQADFPEANEVDEDRLSAFADFVNSLDLEDLDDDDDKK